MSPTTPLPSSSRARSGSRRLRALLITALTAVLVLGTPPSAWADSSEELPPLVARVQLYTDDGTDVTNGDMQPSSTLRVRPYVYPSTVIPHVKLERRRTAADPFTPVALDGNNNYSPTLSDAHHQFRVTLDVTAPGYPPQPTQYRSVSIKAPAAPILTGITGTHEVLPGRTVSAEVPPALLQAFPDATVTWEWSGIDSTSHTSGVIDESMLGRHLFVRYTLTSPTKGEATSDWTPSIPVVEVPKNPVTALVDGKAPGEYMPTTVGARHEATVVGATDDDHVTYEWRVAGDVPGPVVSQTSSLDVTGWWGQRVVLTVRVTNPAYRDAVFTQTIWIDPAQLLPLAEPDGIVPGSGTHTLSFTDVAGPLDWASVTTLEVRFDGPYGPAVPRGSRPDEIVLDESAEGRSVWVAVDALWDSRYYSPYPMEWVKIGVVTTAPITDVTHRVTGDVRVGSQLRLSVSEAAPGQQVEVRWYADGEQIATGETLEVTDALRGRTLSVGYTVTAPGRRPFVAEPTEVGTVPATDEPVLASVSGAKVTITGKAHVGARLTASFSSTPRVATSVVWTRGTQVVGRGASYTVKAADAGARLTARATVDQTGYQAQTASATTATVTAPVSLKVSSRKVKPSTKQTVTVGKVSKGQAVTVRVNGKVVAKATVRGNGRLTSVRTVRTNRVKVTLKASGKTGFKVTFRVAAKKGSGTVTAAVPGRPTAKATYQVR